MVQEQWVKRLMEMCMALGFATLIGILSAVVFGGAHGAAAGIVAGCLFFMYTADRENDIPLLLITGGILSFTLGVYVAIGLNLGAPTGGAAGVGAFLVTLTYTYFKKIK